MRLPHSSNAEQCIVQLQQLPHVTPNSATDWVRFSGQVQRQGKNCEAKMAYVNSRSASVGIVDRFSSVLRMVKDLIERRRVYAQTVAELSGLTDRDLSDLGLSRASIGDVAREAAYAK